MNHTYYYEEFDLLLVLYHPMGRPVEFSLRDEIDCLRMADVPGMGRVEGVVGSVVWPAIRLYLDTHAESEHTHLLSPSHDENHEWAA